MICTAIPCVWMNERHFVHKTKLLDKGKKSVQTGESPDNVNASNDYKLMHLSGKVEGDKVPSDAKMGINIEECVKLERNVEVYQWQETSKEDNEGGTEYTLE